MDDRSIQLFEEALKGGEETVHSIHVMVFGQISGGKTTLFKRLLGQEVDMSKRYSTEGIHVNFCDVSLSTGNWTRQTKDPRYSKEQDIGQDLSSATNQQEESNSAVLQNKAIQSETNKISMIKPPKENSFLTIWDFPGQNAFYSTHQIFLTRRAIFLLVLDVSVLSANGSYLESEAILPKEVYDLVNVCLNSIHSCASSQEVSSPSVILVGTHVDKLSQSKQHATCERFFREIRSYLKDKPTRFYLIEENFAIDNTIVDRRLEDLKRKIVRVASQQSYWWEKIPARWLPLQRELMKLKANGEKMISHEDVVKINKAGTVQMETSEELELFLRFLHETGTVIYDSIEKSRGIIVLDPTWTMNALVSLINAQPDKPELVTDTGTHSGNPTDTVSTQKWSDFKDKGILSSDLIDTIWTKEKYPELHAQKDHMLLKMQQLNMIAVPRAFNETGVVEIENYFFTPCMLRKEFPKEIIIPEQDPLIVSTPVLCCVFTGKVLPPPIFHSLIAACVTRWPVAKEKETSDNLIFYRSCIFNLELFHRLILHCKDHIIFARITRKVDDEVTTPEAKMCIKVRKFITLNLSKIVSENGQNLKYELHSWCSPSQPFSDDGSSAPFQMWFTDEEHDPESPITREHMNHSRLCVALVTVCGNVMRDILCAHVPAPHNDIYQAILANESKLTSGQRKPLLNPDHVKLVFPDPQRKTTGHVDHFDLSLLYVLIRNISSVLPPGTGWGKDTQDQPRDTSLGASVQRIRTYRNEIVGHSTDGEMNQQEFNDYWNKIDAMLDDIEHALGRQGYRAKLEKQKRQVISVYEAC